MTKDKGSYLANEVVFSATTGGTNAIVTFKYIVEST